MAEEATRKTGGSGKRRSKSVSEAVIDRIRRTRPLVASLDTHHEEILDGLDQLLGPHLDEGEELQVGPLLRGLRRLILHRLARLEAADAQQAKEISQDRGLQNRRRQAMAEVRQTLIDLRLAVDTTYGKNVTREFLGLEGRTARTVIELQREGRRVLDGLSDPDGPRPEPKPPHRALDWDAWRTRLEGPVQVLEGIDLDLDLDLAETHGATVRKGGDLEHFDREVGAAGRWLHALYELLGYEQAQKDLLPESRKHRSLKRRGKRTPD